MNSIAVVGAFIGRDWRIDLSYRFPFAFQLAATLFTLALFFYLGRLIDTEQFAASENLDAGYFGFVAVGLGLLEVVHSSLGSFSRKLREEQTAGTLEALMVTPAGTSLIILSSAAYTMIRAALDGLVFILGAVVIFGVALDLDPGSASVALATLLGSMGLFASLGIAVAALTVLFKRTTAILGFVSTGLALLGGVYFPIEVLPQPLEGIAALIPFTWALDALRGSLLGGDVDPWQLLGLFLSAAVLLPIALVAFKSAIRRARKTGSLGEY